MERAVRTPWKPRVMRAAQCVSHLPPIQPDSTWSNSNEIGTHSLHARGLRGRERPGLRAQRGERRAERFLRHGAERTAIGGLLGNAIERKIDEQDGQEIVIQLENGSTIAIVQPGSQGFAPGGRVACCAGRKARA